MKIVNEPEKEIESVVTIRFQDCDPFGHLNNARYLDYFINAREDQLIQYYDFDIYKLGKETRCNWVITKHQISFYAPVAFREEVRIRTSLLRFSENSLLMEGAMLPKDGRNLKSFLWTEFRYVSLATGKSVPHSDELMDFLGRIRLQSDGLEGQDYEARARSLVSRFNLPAA